MRFLFKSTGESAARAKSPIPLFDIHNHCLFQIDDGPRTADESTAILKGLFNLGFRGVMATPHCNHRLFATTDVDTIAARIQQIQSNAPTGIPQLVPSAEIMARDDYLRLIESGSFPHSGDSILLEFGSLEVQDIRLFESAMFRLLTLGLVPILAHVERYSFFQHHPDVLLHLRKAGALLQLDLLSLEDRFGHRAAQFSRMLLDERAIDIAATDVHHMRELPDIEQALHTLQDEYPDQFTALVSENPKRVFQGCAAEIHQAG